MRYIPPRPRPSPLPLRSLISALLLHDSLSPRVSSFDSTFVSDVHLFRVAHSPSRTFRGPSSVECFRFGEFGVAFTHSTGNFAANAPEEDGAAVTILSPSSIGGYSIIQVDLTFELCRCSLSQLTISDHIKYARVLSSKSIGLNQRISRPLLPPIS